MKIKAGSAAASGSKKAKGKKGKKWTKKALEKLVATKDNVMIAHQVKQLKSDPHAKISLSRKKLRKLEKARRRDDREKERAEAAMVVEPTASSKSTKKRKRTKTGDDSMDVDAS